MNRRPNLQAVGWAYQYYNSAQFRDCVAPENYYHQCIEENRIPRQWSYNRWVWGVAYSEAREALNTLEQRTMQP